MSMYGKLQIEDDLEKNKDIDVKFLLNDCLFRLNHIIDSVAKAKLPQFVQRSIKDPILRWTILVAYIELEEHNVTLAHSMRALKSVRNKLNHGKVLNQIDIEMTYINANKIYDQLDLSGSLKSIFQNVLKALGDIIEALGIKPKMYDVLEYITESRAPTRTEAWYKLDPDSESSSTTTTTLSDYMPQRETAPLFSPQRSNAAAAKPPASTTEPSITATPSAASAKSFTPSAASAKSFTPSAASAKSFTPSAASAKSFTPSAASAKSFTPSAVSAKSFTPSAASAKSFTPSAAVAKPSDNWYQGPSEYDVDYDAIGTEMTLAEFRVKYDKGGKGVLVKMLEGLHCTRDGYIAKYNGANVHVDFFLEGRKIKDRRAVPKHNRMRILSAPLIYHE